MSDFDRLARCFVLVAILATASVVTVFVLLTPSCLTIQDGNDYCPPNYYGPNGSSVEYGCKGEEVER